jgi:flagellar hook-length control protein FliK
MPELLIAGSASVTSNDELLPPQKKTAEGNDRFSKLLESGVEKSQKSFELQEDSGVPIVSGDNAEAAKADLNCPDVMSPAAADPDNVGFNEPFIDSLDGNAGRQNLPVGGDFLPLTAEVTHPAAPSAKPVLEVEGISDELTIKGLGAAEGSLLNVKSTIPGPTIEGSSPKEVTTAVGNAGSAINSASTAVPSIEAALRESLPVEGRMATSSLQSESRLDDSVRHSLGFTFPSDRAAGGQQIHGMKVEKAGKTGVADRVFESGAQELALSSRFFSAGPPSQPSEPKSVINAIRETGLQDLSGASARDWVSSGGQGRNQVERAVGLTERSPLRMAAPTLPPAAILESPAASAQQPAPTLPLAEMLKAATPVTQQPGPTAAPATIFGSPAALIQQSAPSAPPAAILESPAALTQQPAPSLPPAAILESPAALTQQPAPSLPPAAILESPAALTQQATADLTSALKSTFTVPNTQVWVGEMREKIDMVLASQRNEIQLKLSPAHLGKIEVLIRRDDDQTALTFFVKNPEVRETLEQGLAKLHRSFSEQGLTMGDTTVSDQTMDEHRDSESVGALPDESGEEAANPLQSDQPEALAVTNTAIGLVNTWA